MIGFYPMQQAKSKFIIAILLIISAAVGTFFSLQENKLSFDEIIAETDFRFNFDTTSGIETVKFSSGQMRYGIENILMYRIEMPYASGDLDNDGDTDYAILIFNWNGGSGQFLYLTAVINKHGNPEQSSIVLLGDRVQVTKMGIEDSVIIVNLIDLRSGTKSQNQYEFFDNQLHLVTVTP